MLLCFVFLCSSLEQNTEYDKHVLNLIDYVSKHRLYLFHKKLQYSFTPNLLIILNNFVNLDSFLYEVHKIGFNVSLGFSESFEFAVAKNIEQLNSRNDVVLLNKNETLLGKSQFSFTIIEPTKKMKSYLLCLFLAYVVLFSFYSVVYIKHGNNFYLFISNNGFNFPAFKSFIPSKKLLDKLYNHAFKTGSIASTELSYNTETKLSKKLHIIPFCKEYHCLLYTESYLKDADFGVPMEIDVALAIQDDLSSYEKCKVIVNQTSESSVPQVSVDAPNGTIIIKRQTGDIFEHGNYYSQLGCVFEVNISIIHNIMSRPPTMKDFLNNVKERFIRLDYNALYMYSIKLEKFNKNVKFDEDFDLIIDCQKDDQSGAACRKLLKQNIFESIGNNRLISTRVTNADGYRGYGYVIKLGDMVYLMQAAISYEFCILRSPERTVSNWAIVISMYYHIHFHINSDSTYLKRLLSTLKASHAYTFLEIHDGVQKHSRKSKRSSLFSFNSMQKKITRSGSNFCDFLISHPQKIYELFSKANSKTRTIVSLDLNAEKAKIDGNNNDASAPTNLTISVIGDQFYDSVTDTKVNTLFLEDLSTFLEIEASIKDKNSDIETISRLLGFHKLANQSTLCNDSLSTELGYKTCITSLLELIYPEDVHLLREIKNNTVTIFRLKNSASQPIWYAAICSCTKDNFEDEYLFNGGKSNAEMSSNDSNRNDLSFSNSAAQISFSPSFEYYESNIRKNDFSGYVFSINKFTNDKNSADDYFDDSMLSAVSDLFALWAVDTITNSVTSYFANGSDNKYKIRTTDDILKLVHPGDINQFKDILFRQFNQLNNETKISRNQIRMSLNSSNEYFWHEVIMSKQRDCKIIILVMNISEQKKTFDALVEARQLVDIALYHSNVVQWIFEDSETPERIFTSGPITYEPLMLNWTSIYHNILPEFQEVTRKAFKNALTSDEPFEVKAPVFFTSIKWILLRGRRGTKKGQLIGVYFDLTDINEASNALEKQRKAAEEAASAKSIFLANMSHEIRTPLNGMLGLLEFLMASDLTEEEHGMLNVVQSSFNRLLELLNDTLDLAKIDQNKMQPSNTIFSLTGIFDQLYTNCYQQVKNNPNVSAILDVDPAFPLTFYGEPHIIHRVVTNLLSNAIKFTQKGTILISHDYKQSSAIDKKSEYQSKKASNHYDESLNEQLIVTVQDTGIGISEEKQKIIFESFTQVDSSITRQYGGSGIGLSLVSKMINLIGGSISLQSSPGVGSTFKVSFPCQALYFPYIPRRIKDFKLQVLMLHEPDGFELYYKFADYYGFNCINSEDEVIPDRLALVVCNNYSDKSKIIDRLKKQCPLARFVLVLHSEKDYHDNNLETFVLPVLPSIIRTRFLAMKFKHLKLAKLHCSAADHDSLPAVVPDSTEASSFGPNTSLMNLTKNKLNPENLQLNVLVAEDNSTNQMVIGRILQKIHCKWHIVENGKEAINRLESDKYDIILMDHQMPIMNGPEAARLIRSSDREYSRIPIIAMTASTDSDDRDECLKSGMNAFVSKPIKAMDLANTIVDVMDNPTSVLSHYY